MRDVRRERGSLVGIHTALTAAETPVLVLAWDMPFVTPELLALIVRLGADEQFAVIPEGPSGLEPFCALYTPACLPIVDRAIDEGDLRSHQSAASISVVHADSARPMSQPSAIQRRLFFNVNSAADLVTAEAMEQEQRSRHQ